MDAGSFAGIFGLIFVAELPDKTAVAALVLASKHKPLPVFVGTAAALVVQSLIAVAAGGLLSKLPARPVQIGSAIVFLVSAVLMWRRKEEKDDGESLGSSNESSGRTLATVFGVVFLAELGDLTQVSTAALAAKLRAPLLVFSASSAALISVAAIAVFVGNRAGRLLQGNLTQRIAAVIFALVGVAMLIGWPKA